MCNNQAYKKFDGLNKDKDFYPLMVCPACSKEFNFFLSVGNRRGNSSFHSCTNCANLLIIDFEGGIFNVYYFDRKHADNLRAITEVILDNVKPCICGGHFQMEAQSKCPYCFHVIDKTLLLAYLFIQRYRENAFRSKKLYDEYKRDVNNKVSDEKFCYRYGVELAMDYQKRGLLRDQTEQQIQKLRCDALPILTAYQFEADMWTVENPKRALFELLIDNFFKPRREGLDEITYTSYRYNLAYAISVLAKQPFEKQEIDPLKLQFCDFQKYVSENQQKFNKMSGSFDAGKYSDVLEKAKELKMDEWKKKYIEHSEFVKNVTLKPWRINAEKEIERWQKWWEDNKDKLPV